MMFISQVVDNRNKVSRRNSITVMKTPTSRPVALCRLEWDPYVLMLRY